MSKIIFIEPKSPNLHIYSQFPLPRLGSFILGTLMKKRGWDVDIIVEEQRAVDFNDVKSADLVGISTITSTAPRAYAIAKKVREMGIPVILGGPHVTFLPEEGLDYADFVIRGEAEHPIMMFIDAWENRKEYTHVPNLSYKKNGKAIHNPMESFIANLDDIPFPELALLQNNTKRIGGQTIIPIQTSRGCPYNCSFCSVTGMFGRKYRFRSPENIIAELKQYDDRRNFVFFYDDHFTANRRRAKILLEKMIQEKFKFKWSTQVRADIGKDIELVKLMKKAGCYTLFIGFESVNPESLKAMKKQQTIDEIVNAIKVLQKHRIHIHGMFVYGFDEDDWQTVKETVKFAKRAKLNSTQFLILTPLPGSEFYNQMCTEKRIQFRDWNLYDAHHVVFRPARFSLFDLQKAQIYSHQKFYSLMETVKKILKWKLVDVGLAHYARRLNRLWKKKNKTFLKVVDLLTPKKKTIISIDYREKIILDDERVVV
ncbi:B12-binding domain-containing radical SAM protein [bacterium]|nr:B12-binding domain-containing radical SAM protein [bacterium]RQV96347.1 MAG: radical SAM protein [bacterium]